MVNFTTVACRISSWLKWHKNYKNRLRLAKVIVKNKMLRFMVHCACFYRTGVIADQSFTFRDGNVWPFRLLWPWTRSGDFNLQTEPVSHGDIPDVWKWTSYIKAFESYPMKGGECVQLVKCGHCRSRDKDGGRTIRSAVCENPMTYTDLTALCVIELPAIEVYTAGINSGSCDLDLDPMTFIYELGPYCLEIYRLRIRTCYPIWAP